MFWSCCIICACVVVGIILLFPFKLRLEFLLKKGDSNATLFLFNKKLLSKTKDEKIKSQGNAINNDNKSLHLEENSANDNSSHNSEETQSQDLKKNELQPCSEKSVANDKNHNDFIATNNSKQNDNVDSIASLQKNVDKIKPQENAENNKLQHLEENSANENSSHNSEETQSQHFEKNKTQPCSRESVANDIKRKLSDNEFYTLLLSTKFFNSTWWAVKNWLSDFAYLSKLHSKNCVVEGIRMEYLHMGYGACINAFLKSMPFFRAWDFRMDWTHSSEFLAKGSLRANINLCNTLVFLLDTLFYAAFVLALFFIKRRRILKTGKLPKLGFIRKKIATMLSEE